jgi:hypothetical protein
VWPATAVCCTLPLDTVVPYVSALEYNYGGFIPPGQNLTLFSQKSLHFDIIGILEPIFKNNKQPMKK